MEKKQELGLVQEFLQYWERLENKGFFFGLFAVWVALFQWLGNSTLGYIYNPSLFAWTYDAVSGPRNEDGHVLLMPFAILGLFWWKRELLITRQGKVWSPALLILVLAILLHLIGHVIQQPRVSLVAFLVGVYGLIGLAWGKQFLKASFFPCILFVFCVPVANMGIVEKVTLPLRLLATNVTYHFCNSLLGFNVVRQGTQLFDGAGGYSYDVAAACSGIRSLIALTALTTIYGVITFTSLSKRLAIVILAVPLALACNTLRLMSVVVAAEAFGQKAGDFVHEWSGFLTYAIALAVLFTVGYFWQDKKADIGIKDTLSREARLA
jgi:exosortase